MSSTEASAPVIAGIHHLKFPVSDIDASLDWYTSVLSASRQPELDHFTASGTRYAVELKVPGMAQGVLELRADKENAAKAKGFDPVTFAVQSKKDLDGWGSWLDKKGVHRSKVFVGVTGWVLCFEDLDGRFLRLYTLETHEKTTDVDHDEYWLGTPGE